MKKFLAIIAIASLAVACGGSGEKKDVADSTGAVIDSTVKAATDTLNAVADTAKAKIDSTVKAVADTAKAKM